MGWRSPATCSPSPPMRWARCSGWRCCWPPRRRCGSASTRWAAPIWCGWARASLAVGGRGGGRATRVRSGGRRRAGSRPPPFLQGVLTRSPTCRRCSSSPASSPVSACSPPPRDPARRGRHHRAANGIYLALLAWLMQRQAARAFYARNRGLMEIGFGLLFLSSAHGSWCAKRWGGYEPAPPVDEAPVSSRPRRTPWPRP